MRVAGIIAEYDPFHNGHEAHIAATRHPEGAGATHIVAVISGSFTQRGEPAMLTKFDRTAMALAGGADLVLEMPVSWSMAPAERFAAGGVAILHALGCVDVLSFGSECGDVRQLEKLAALLDSPNYAQQLRQEMAAGISYAAARQTAAAALSGAEEASLIAGPNNTLALEYIRAAKRQQAPFSFFTLRRQGAAHTSLTPQSGYASATLLRESVRSSRIEAAVPYMPEKTRALLEKAIHDRRAPSDWRRLEMALLAQLRRMTQADFSALPYLSEGLENRLYRAVQTAGSFTELITAVKTRRYPLARIRRILWAALLNMQATDVTGPPHYIRVLGMNRKGREILAAANPSLPLITRSQQIAALPAEGQAAFRLENLATDLHALTLPTPAPCATDYTAKLLVVD